MGLITSDNMALVLGTTCDFSVYLIEKVTLVTQPSHVLYILLCTVHMGEAFILASATAIDCLITVWVRTGTFWLVSVVVTCTTACTPTLPCDDRDILTEVINAEFTFSDRMQSNIGRLWQKFVLCDLAVIRLTRQDNLFKEPVRF